MSKRKILFISLILGSLVLAGAFYYKHSETISLASRAEMSEEQFTYQVQVKTVLNNPKATHVVLDLDAMLKTQSQGREGIVSEWESITRMIAMDAAVDASAMLHSKSLSVAQDKLLTHYLQADFPPQFAALQENILSRFFVPIPAGTQDEVYLSEKEARNLMRVKYSITPRAGGSTMKRSWIQVIQGLISIDGKDNTFVYEYDAKGNLESMSGGLTLKGNDQEDLPFSLSTVISIKRASQAKLARAKLKFIDYRGLVTASSDTDEPIRPEELRSLKEVFASLDRFNENDTPEDRAALYRELAKILKADPSTLKDFKAKILAMSEENSGATQLQINVLFSVLAGAETTESADVLADLFSSDCKDELCRMFAINAFSLHSNMSVESASKVLHVAETSPDPQIAYNAYLASGAAGRVLGDRFTELRPSLMKAMKSADEVQDETAKALVIRAIGNTGDRAFLPVLKDNFASENEHTKNMAYFALRFIPGEDVNDTLLGSLESEKNPMTSTEILRSSSMREFSKNEYSRFAEKASTWDKGDKDLTVETIGILVDAYSRNPDSAGPALELLKAKVKLPELKELIVSGMNPLGASPAYSNLDDENASDKADDAPEQEEQSE